MEYKLLLVDDDENLLRSFKRVLSRRLLVDTATDGKTGLEKVRTGGPYAVVISDYKMPGMDGVEFLAEVGRVSPDTVRVLLTAYANLQVAVDAVNTGNIFRLLTKPCPKETLAEVIKAGLRQYQLLRSEKDLLEQTVAGAMKLMGEMMHMLNAEASERIGRILPLLRFVGKDLGDRSVWATESAAILSQLGYVLLPEEVRERVEWGKDLKSGDRELYKQYPEVSGKLISHIPRLENVAQIARYAEKNYDGSGIPEDGVAGDSIPLGSRIVKTLMDYDRALSETAEPAKTGDRERAAVVEKMRGDPRYDPKVLESLQAALDEEKPYRIREVPLSDLKVGMILGEDLYSERKGQKTKIMAQGHEINAMGLEYIQSYAGYLNLKNTIRIIEIL
ncbi:HD domain-containing phosphohydrolase [Desulfohalovibrio reitneri]|uniref:HD domain-containing phosphohydrolase n=1 Tax=Desulfohalovibrio reitneri TaxID=1307759 RepID=UPI0004A73D66|nr:HD domain-containing phosphohydrolase [Desulfohalovibrio reitneri]